MSAVKIVVIGGGDTGILVAQGLKRLGNVTMISPRMVFQSGQEVGARLTRFEEWRKHYFVPLESYRGLRGVELVQGMVETLDPTRSTLVYRTRDGSSTTLCFDYAVVASGVRNGFWRTVDFCNEQELLDRLALERYKVAIAEEIAVIGAGATGVSLARALSRNRHTVNLYFPGGEILSGYANKTRAQVTQLSLDSGVFLHPDHRARLPPSKDLTALPSVGRVEFEGGKNAIVADLVLWTVGNLTPNSSFLPTLSLNESGFVKVDEYLRVQDTTTIFCVGDVAASDPLRCSARNQGHTVVVKNIRAAIKGKEPSTAFHPTTSKWGSILGLEQDGLRVFSPSGFMTRIPAVICRKILFPFVVDRMIYGGIDRKALKNQDSQPFTLILVPVLVSVTFSLVMKKGAGASLFIVLIGGCSAFVVCRLLRKLHAQQQGLVVRQHNGGSS